MSDVKRYDICGKLHRVTGNPVALTEESPSGKWALASDYAALQSKHDAAVALLRTIMKEADVYEPVNDGTRNWCPELSIYLRGNYGLMVTLTPEEYETLKQLTTPKE
jgi:hypothetical protein